MSVINDHNVYWVSIAHVNGERVQVPVFKVFVASHDEAKVWIDRQLHHEWSIVE
ncbi:hypothetical protein BH753_gp050 [Bacillus phage Shbh1]|uniref:Uncharacterized protein n=1 Tax=Bacillus phage Shbh1 TaxID=1796992 RepID=A0A142F175_9CAUD|nr:hypothetical protein BH753_gp050 [Bacillus phage Shbh1]AMQ66532.1 hypothetical protein [Bacillus phage Shbh1]